MKRHYFAKITTVDEQVGRVLDALEARVLPTPNVRAALAAVESGGAEAGIVYATDAAISAGVDIAFVVPRDAGPEIRYPAAAIHFRPRAAQARRYLEYLRTPAALEVFRGYGFVVDDGAGAQPPTRRRASRGAGFAEAVVPLWLSIKVASLATLVVFFPGCLIGLVLSRKRFPGKSIVETLVELPLVLPPTAIGYMLLLTFAKSGPLGRDTLPFDPGILFTWRAAVIASAVMALPLVARTARIAFDNVDPRLERMAASLGMSRVAVKLRVTLPIAGRGLMAAALIGFSRALGEFGATALVAGNIEGKTRTLALAIFNDIQEGHHERARALLAIAIALAFAAVATVGWLQRRDRKLRGEEQP